MPINKLFAACEAVLRRADRLRLGEGQGEAGWLRERLVHCPGRATNACPRATACRERLPDRPSPADALGRRSFAQGLLQSFALKDGAGNAAQIDLLSTDIARAYETAPLRGLLAMHERMERPGWSDFDTGRLEARGWLTWLGVASFEDAAEKVYKRYPPGMRRTVGADYAGASASALPPVGNEAFRNLSQLVRQRRQPVYCRFSRTWIDRGAVKLFAMRRLELPVFRGNEVAGSLIYLVPETWSTAPAVGA